MGVIAEYGNGEETAKRQLAYVGVGEDGKRRYKSFTAPTKKEAELLAAQYVAQEARKQDTGMRVGEAIDRYIEIKAGILSPSTVLGYKRQRRNCYDQVSGLYVDGLTSSQLQKWISDFSRGNSPKYVP
jgi:hypothetical protein